MFLQRQVREITELKIPAQSPSIKDKKRQTTLKNYGVENPSQSASIKDKKVQTTLKNYGVEYTFQSEECRNKSRQTTLKNYGVENPQQCQEIRNRTYDTNLERYGVKHPLQSTSIMNKMVATNLDRYDVEYIGQSEDIKLKIRKVWIEKYGADHPAKTEAARLESKLFNLRNRLKIIEDFKVLGYLFISHTNGQIFTLQCPTCNQEFTQSRDFLRQRMVVSKVELCTHCNPIDTQELGGEKDLSNFVKSLGVEIERI